MNRRQALQSIGVAAALPLSASELFAFGRRAHAQVRAAGSDERYVFLSLNADESETLSVAAELIIPETDTPGARTARVPEFIDSVLWGWFNEDERKRFLRGIRDLNERARVLAGESFPRCASAAQIGILRELEAEARQALESVEPTRLARRAALSAPEAPFFSVLKWLTVFGYYTSAAGMDQELEHVEFPGTYDGCSPLRGHGGE